MQSVLLFGDPDYNLALANPSLNFTVPLLDRGNYYKIELSQSAYGFVGLTQTAEAAILDTGTSLLGMSPSSYQALLTFITNTYEYEIDQNNNVLTIC